MKSNQPPHNKSLDELTVVPDRPPSLDQVGRRLFIIPASVNGYFRKRRHIFYGFLVLLFLVVPWTTFNGQQTILLHLSSRRFIFFDQLFFAHDAPLIFFLLMIAAFSIIFLTALFGRIWCGWACPQTVFIEFIYRRIEEWTEGNYLKRRKLENQPLTPKIFFKKIIKWTLFFLASSHISHSAFAYFVGAHELLNITLHAPQQNWALFVAVQVVTFVLLINFGWFREQFCLIACPYGRFQSALMDENSLAVLYDKKRGEPRRQKGLPKEDQGDCINCMRCVNVCPTGIDIRNGLQMECIACTACIDACDEVMEKVNKPKGLIRYTTEREQRGKKRKRLNLRNTVYSLLILLLFIGITFSVLNRNPLEVKILRATASPYQFTSAEKTHVVNHFRIHLTNQSQSSIQIKQIKILNESVETVAPQITQSISPGQSTWVHVFLTFPVNKSQRGKLEVDYKIDYSIQENQTFDGHLLLLAPTQ